MINTAIIQSCSARSNSIEVWGIIFKELSNSLIFLVVSPSCYLKYFQLSRKMFSYHLSVTFTLFIFDVANCSFNFAVLSNMPSDNAHYTAHIQCQCVTYTQSRTDTPHGLLFEVIDDHEVKACIDTFKYCAPPRKHCIISSFK